MLSSKLLKQIMSEARPIIERQLDDAELIAGLRDVFAAEGGDWGALKALIKSQVQDERDEVGDGKRIRKLRDRSGNQLAYADMLGLGEMNEQNYSEDDDREADVVVSDTIDSDVNRLRVSVDPRIAAILARTESTTPNTSVPEGFDPETGEEVTTPEITEPQPETAVQTVTVEAPVVASPVESEAVEISAPILEQQPAPAARDLTAPQALNGQVANHTLETANKPHSLDPALEQGLSDARTDLIIPSSGHETGVRGAGGAAIQPETANEMEQPVLAPSDPLRSETATREDVEQVAPTYADPGEVVMESCPPVGIVTHPYAACWPVNTVNVEDGIRQPIVKIGNLILDGRGRYFAARAAHVEYPVVQYAGDDDLADSITWNLASRPGMDPRALRIVAEKLAKLVPDRAEEIMERFGFNEEQRAAQ